MTSPQRLLALLALPLLIGCGPDDTPDDTPDTETDTDVTEDVVDDSGDDVDAAEDIIDEEDGSTEPIVTVTGTCETHRDCQEVGGTCVDGECLDVGVCAASNWLRCRHRLEDQGLEGEDLMRATCVDTRCAVPCLLDGDCYDGEICTNYGTCEAFTHDLTLPRAGGEEHRALQAGYGEALLGFPVGSPLAGYGSRAAVNAGRYAVSLEVSNGTMRGLYARAALLDTGDRRLMVVRLPMIFPSFAIHEEIANHLQELTGEDWRDSLVINATHTHSGPARFWQLFSVGFTELGAFGTGEFSQYFYDWITDSIKEAVEAALNDLEPAELGWTIVESFDNDDEVGHDRWDQTPEFDDNRTLVIRVDDADGTPKMSLISFSAHGTANTYDYMSNDVIGGAEQALTELNGETYGDYVPTLFFNSNTGTMGHGGGRGGHSYPQNAERLGWAFQDAVWDAYQAIETSEDIALDSANIRYPMTYELVGYEEGEWGDELAPPLGGQYTYGAISCTAPRHWGDTDFSTFPSIEDLTCVGMHFMIANRPPSLFLRSQTMAISLDGLTILTAPGELSQELSWEMIRAVRDGFGVDPLAAWTWGYSNAHLLYLLPTALEGDRPPYPGLSLEGEIADYPEYAFSYLQGGYEASLSAWGPRMGDFLVGRALEAYEQLTDPDAERVTDDVLPQFFPHRDEEPFPMDEVALETVEIIEDMPATVTRFEPVELAWIGGDPGAEMPQTPLVALERETEDGWVDAETTYARPYTNRERRFMTRVRYRDESWQWIARWEELKDFPEGTYRMRIEGHVTPDGVEAYTLYSSTFEVVASDALEVTATPGTGTLDLAIAYPADTRMAFEQDTTFTDPGAVTGHFRMRHPNIPTGTAVPLNADDLPLENVAVSLSQGGSTVLDAGADALTWVGDDPMVALRLDTSDLVPGTYELTVTATDHWGNTANVTQSLDL